MNGIGRLGSFFRRKSPPRYIEHGEWPEPAGSHRVLIENPDAATLWAHAEILREAGYDVATCAGPAAEPARVPWYRRRPGDGDDPQAPERGARVLCPLVAHGHCPLVEGADVVISTTGLTDGREIVATLRARKSPVLLAEGTSAELERDSDVISDAFEIEEPVTPELLVSAVAGALSSRSAGAR